MTQSQDGVPTEAVEPRILRIDRIDLTVANLDAAQAFYTQALGFQLVALEPHADAALGQAALMRLGDQTLELLRFDRSGLPYPEPRAANDPWFQHFAIAVDDMDAAFAQLSRFPQQPISRGGPQRLPPSTGDVTAYKFRDPEGHPVELSLAPHSPWAGRVAAAPFATLGIDHSALAVADLEVSLRFYTEMLGLRRGPSSLNQGPEQARLDGLDDPVVDIATLFTRDAGPHIELLHYRKPRPSASPRALGLNDIAAVRLVMQTDTLDEIAHRAAAHVVSNGIVTTPEGRRLLLRDPDGHLMELFSLGESIASL